MGLVERLDFEKKTVSLRLECLCGYPLLFLIPFVVRLFGHRDVILQGIGEDHVVPLDVFSDEIKLCLLIRLDRTCYNGKLAVSIISTWVQQ